MTSQSLEAILDKFNDFTQKPATFLTAQTNAKKDYKNLVKSLYDLTKSNETKKKKSTSSALSELIVQDFDEEQVWQQIELQNTECWDQLVWEVANCMSVKSALNFPVTIGDESQGEEETLEDEVDENSEPESEKSDHEEVMQTKPLPKKSNTKSSIVDDDFFNLKDMEKFLIKEEKHGGQLVAAESDEDSIDLFDEIDDEPSDEEEGGDTMKYADFFNQEGEEINESDPNSDKKLKKKADKKVSFADETLDEMNDDFENEDDEYDEMDEEETYNKGRKSKMYQPSESSDDDSEVDISKETETNKETEPKKDEKQSEFELRQQRLKQTITRLEEKNLNEAPWQLKGEIDASKRPQNSLLQEVLDFDLTTRPPPIITEQTTETLEDIIKRRIKDKAWDDVVKKAKPVDDALAFRKTEVLDHAKSKLSLAQVYEAEYLKQKGGDETAEEKEPESHTQVREAMNKLFAQLDALSHYHYTPKAAQPEVKIVSNTPAISMEEVAPVAASSASLLAPEEVKKKGSGELMSKVERTDTDKKRERRKKKNFQRAKGTIAKVTDNRNTKKGTEATDKSLKTSKAFFQQLNDDSSSLIKNSNKRKNFKNKGQ